MRPLSSPGLTLFSPLSPGLKRAAALRFSLEHDGPGRFAPGPALPRGRSGAKYKGWRRALAAVPGLRPLTLSLTFPRTAAPHASGRGWLRGQGRGAGRPHPRCLPGRRGGKGRSRSGHPITARSPGGRLVAAPQERDGGGGGGTEPRRGVLPEQSPSRHPGPGALGLQRRLGGRVAGAGYQHGRHHRHGAGRQG